MQSECIICMEQFIYIDTPFQLFEKYEEFFRNREHTYKNEVLFKGLLISDSNDVTQLCEYEKCKSHICGTCWVKIMFDGKSIDEIENNDVDIYKIIKCPLCRQQQWKHYMSNSVFNELTCSVKLDN
jgi:hypothetical protein